MQKYNRIISFTIVLLFLTGLWIIIAFINFSSTKKTTSNKSLLPDDIELVMSINTQELIQTFLVDLLFKSDLDEKTAQLFIPEESSEINKLGVDLSSEIVVFYDTWNNSSAKGVVLNISNEGDFNRYQIDEKSTIKYSNSEYGVLIYLDEKASLETITHYTQLAERIINAKKDDIVLPKSKGLINLSYKGDQLSYLKDLELDLNIHNQTIEFNGKGKLNQDSDSKKTKSNILTNPASEKYFAIETSTIPEDAMNYLTATFNEIGISSIPKVSSLQLLMYGITIDEFKGSTAFLPSFDWILRFDEPLSIDSILLNLRPNYQSIVDLKEKTINIGNVKYYYSQLSEKEIFIGITPKPDISLTEIQPTYSLSGFPSAILEIEGRSFFASFIKMLPPVKLSKQFLQDVTHFDIRTEQEGETLKIKGEVELKEGKLMTVELVKLWLLL